MLTIISISLSLQTFGFILTAAAWHYCGMCEDRDIALANRLIQKMIADEYHFKLNSYPDYIMWHYLVQINAIKRRSYIISFLTESGYLKKLSNHTYELTKEGKELVIDYGHF